MLRQLRTKFIALDMAIATLVLAVVFGTICAISCKSDEADVMANLNEALSFAEEHERMEALGEQAPPPEEGATAPPTIGKRPEGNGARIPVAVYLLESDGSIASGPTSTASIPEETADSALEAIAGTSQQEGLLEDEELFFSKREIPEGTLVAFADQSTASSWQKLAAILAAVGAIALGVFFLISIFFSRWALKPVETAWMQQQRFIADASHELKTPITVILANSAILKSHPESTLSSQEQWIDSTQSEALRMQELVNDMLEMARPKNNDAENATRQPVDMSDLVENIALQFESVAFEQGVSIDCEIEPSIHVKGDPKRLVRLARTLMDNACKYSAAGTVVTVCLKGNAKNAALSVHNNGQSIPPEDLPHIFDRFYRTDKARSSSTGGFGLGLSIAQEIAKEHGGAISAESTREAGTTFTVTLPRLP